LFGSYSSSSSSRPAADFKGTVGATAAGGAGAGLGSFILMWVYATIPINANTMPSTFLVLNGVANTKKLYDSNTNSSLNQATYTG
jgi:hypothetical protein